MLVAQTNRLHRLLADVDVRPGEPTRGRHAGHVLSSHFQPIYSPSHTRVVGHEALVRATGSQGQPIAPPLLFQSCRDEDELAWCDSLSRVVHISNFARQGPQAQWLFLNVHPSAFQRLVLPDGDRYLRAVHRHFAIGGERLVLEVLESAVSNPEAFDDAVGIARQTGCLIAIDDFGAGHSNFDRVWRIQPDIVKLDRSLVVRAAKDRRAQRMVSQMVSLLHECGAMVLMEGIETLDEALFAMEADADMVQGYFFGRPQAELVPDGYAPECLQGLYTGLGQLRQRQRVQHRNAIAPFLNAAGHAGVLLSAGRSMEEACGPFLDLPGAELCYVLDSGGYQIGENLWSTASLAQPRIAYEPLRDSRGACWARRPYFRRAIEAVEKVQVTRPYRTLHGNHLCVTVSVSFHVTDGQRSELRVVCGDVAWEDAAGTGHADDTRF